MRCRGVGTVPIIILFKLELDKAKIGLPPLAGGEKEAANSRLSLRDEIVGHLFHA